MISRRDHLLSLAAAAALTACGGGGGGDPTPEPTPAPTPGPTPAPTPAPTPEPTPAPTQPPAPQPPGTVQVRGGVYTGIGTVDGTGTEAYFPGLSDIAIAGDGTLYVADIMLRAVTPEGVTRTVAGAYDPFQQSMIDGPRGQGTVGLARRVAPAADGTLFFIDAGGTTAKIRRLGTDGTLSTIADLAQTWGWDIAATADGFLYTDGSALFRYTDATGLRPWSSGGEGHVDGPLATARFSEIKGIAAAPDGTVYVAQPSCVRKITPAGLVSTIGPTNRDGGDADGSASAARFDTIRTIAAARDGSAVAWDERGGLRRIALDGSVTTITQPMRITATSEAPGLAITASGDLLMTWGRGIVRLSGGSLSNFAGLGILPGSVGQPLTRVRGMAVDRNGNTALSTDQGQHRYAFDWSRTGLPIGGATVSVAADAATGDLIFASRVTPLPGWSSGGSVQREGPSGEITVIASWSRDTTLRIAPGPIAAGRDGNFYFVNRYAVEHDPIRPPTNGTIIRLRTDGTASGVFDPAAFGIFPAWPPEELGGRLAATSDATLYWLAWDNALYRIRDGEPTKIVPAGQFKWSYPWLTVDAADRVLVADGEVIYEVASDGQLAVRAGTRNAIGPRSGPLPGVLPRLLAIAPGPGGLLYAVATNMLLTIRL